MNMYLFTDLDDTWFQTLRKCEDGRRPEEPLVPGADSLDGTPLSFLLPRQQSLFALLNTHMRIVPVTARSFESFQRVRLPFTHGAVLNYGATILSPAGEEDAGWRDKILNELERFRTLLESAEEFITTVVIRNSLTSRVRYISDPASGIPFYVLVKNPDRRTEQLDIIHAEINKSFHPALPWRLHHNDNNLAILPGCLDKKRAVAHFMATHIPAAPPWTCLGMGDSLEDLGFMSLCDYTLVPSGSQIALCRLNARGN